jgi:hypothetical protein
MGDESRQRTNEQRAQELVATARRFCSARFRDARPMESLPPFPDIAQIVVEQIRDGYAKKKWNEHSGSSSALRV